MKFTINEKEYDTDNLSKEGKVAFSRLTEYDKRKANLQNEITDVNLLIQFYSNKIVNEFTKEEKSKKKVNEKNT